MRNICLNGLNNHRTLLDAEIVRYLRHRGLAGLKIFYKREIPSGFYLLLGRH